MRNVTNPVYRKSEGTSAREESEQDAGSGLRLSTERLCVQQPTASLPAPRWTLQLQPVQPSDRQVRGLQETLPWFDQCSKLGMKGETFWSFSFYRLLPYGAFKWFLPEPMHVGQQQVSLCFQIRVTYYLNMHSSILYFFGGHFGS